MYKKSLKNNSSVKTNTDTNTNRIKQLGFSTEPAPAFKADEEDDRIMILNLQSPDDGSLVVMTERFGNLQAVSS